MLIALRGSYDYFLYNPVYGMLNRQGAALQIALHLWKGYSLYKPLVN